MKNAWEIGTTYTNLGGEISKEEPLPKLRHRKEEHLTARLFRMIILNIGFVHFF
jgi:hypothetical protein